MKNIYKVNILKNIMVVLMLIFIYFHNSGIAKMMVIPFITCGFFSIGKNICLLMNKKKYANIFNKLFILSFIIFLFFCLIIWSYLVIRKSNYFALIFTIPFWIAGVYITGKYIFGINVKTMHKQKEPKFNFKIIISCFLVFTILIIGFFCLFFGIRDTYKLNEKTKNYLIIEGFLKNYSIYNINESQPTYKLIYIYKVDGKEYLISTDYGVELKSIPKINSKIEIRYNPNKPSEAVLSGANKSNFLIYFGAFFTLGGSVFVLAVFYIKGVFDKFKIDIMGTYLGLVCTIIGLGIILFQNQTTSCLLDKIKTMGMWLLIPLLLIVSGVSLIVKSLFFKNNNR